MNLEQIIQELQLKIITNPNNNLSEITPTSGYASDLLSCVMAGAARHGIWVTLQSHINIVAVAALLELSAIIITEDAQPDENTISKAIEENIILLSTPHPTFYIIGKLWDINLRSG